MDTQELKRIVEALIFAAEGPLSAERILETLAPQNGFELNAVIDELNREYQESGRAFTIRQVAGGYQIVTQPDYANWIKKLYLGRQKTRLSQAALETLALIAFKQPISRVEIAQIRGVNSDGVIGTLLERRLITISGRSEGVGRPLLYSTTPEFLKYFGLNDLADLPKPREIEELFSKEGMPEELLHALSQDDPQLSLPINAEAEPASSSEDIESNTPTVAPPESSSASETEIEVVPIDINDEVVTLLDDIDAAQPARDDGTTSEPRPPAAAAENPITIIDVASELPMSPDHSVESDSPLDILSLVPPTPQTNHEEILPETLAAGVNEVFKATSETPSDTTQVVEVSEVREINDIPVISSLVLDETPPASPALFSPANAEETKVVIAAPINFESTNDVFLATLESINHENAAQQFDEKFIEEEDNPTAALQSDAAGEVDGWPAEEFSRDEIVEPEFLLKTDERLLHELRNKPVNAAPPLDTNGATTADSSHHGVASPVRLQSPGLDEIFQEVKTRPLERENATGTENNSTTTAALDALSLAPPDFSEMNKIAMPPTETSPEAIAEPSAAAPTTPGEAEHLLPLSIATEENAPFTAAALVVDAPIPLAQNAALQLLAKDTERPGENGGRWTSFRDKTTGWIKRALAKLKAFVGIR